MNALNKYSQEEQDALIALGFHWVEQDKEWYNDKGKTIYSFYRQSYDNDGYIFKLYSTWHDDEGDFKEDYEYFDTIGDFVKYIK